MLIIMKGNFIMRVEAGTINLGNKVMVSDPCYSVGTWCQGVLENVKSGTWNCAYGFDEDEERVFYIHLSHNFLSEREIEDAMVDSEAADFEVGVDSGTAGVYDYDYYTAHHSPERDEEWYGKLFNSMKERTENENFLAFLKEKWFVDAIDTYLKGVAEYLEPEDGYCLCYSMGVCLSSIFEVRSKYFDEFLSSRVENAGFVVDDKVSSDSWKSIDALLDRADEELRKTLTETKQSIPYYQLRKFNEIWRAVTLDDKAFVSPSGFGDGGYNCYFHRNEDGEIDYIEIYFYNPDEE